MECVQLAGAVVRCGLSLRTSYARPGSGQEPEGTATVKPPTCHLPATSKPSASRVHGRCSGVFFVFSWYSHGIHPLGTHRNFGRARQTIPVYSRHSATSFLRSEERRVGK